MLLVIMILDRLDRLILFTDCVKGPIEEDILLVNNEIISDCIGERIVSYKGANNNILSNLKLTSMLSLDFTSTWVALLILYSVYT